MPKPRIFLSSTCYDLTPHREELTLFLEILGFEVLNSQNRGFGVNPGVHSHTACIEEVRNSDYLLLLIGGRHGGNYIGSTKSITNEEYSAARKLDIPCIGCVNKAVDQARHLYKKNTSGDFTSVVDDKRIFHFIDFIVSDHSNNWLHKFERISDIKEILTSQFAHYLFEYSRSLRATEKPIAGSDSMPLVEFPGNMEGLSANSHDQDEITATRSGLRFLHSLISDIVRSPDMKLDAKREKLKTLWVYGKYGNTLDSDKIEIHMDTFKQYAWSTGRHQRVMKQFADLRVDIDIDEEGTSTLVFEKADSDHPIAWALETYIQALIKKHGEQDAEAMFYKADMRIFQGAGA